MMRLIKDEIVKFGKTAFDISYISERGGRTINEDTVAVECARNRLLLSVADGLGGHGGGDIASFAATEVVKEKYMKAKVMSSKKIYNIFQAVDKAVVAKQTEDVQMKTTLACVFCGKKHIHAAHLGDTRIYTFKENNIYRITADHSLAYEEITANHGDLNDIRNSPNRHILKAALGVGRIRPPDVFEEKIEEDLSILICSDGFWEYVNEDEMSETLSSTETSHKWLEKMLKCHREKAIAYSDNYSAICLRIKRTREGDNLCSSMV